jgi:hypothetical protein
MASENEKGIQATIFIDPPADESFREAKPNTTYLISCNQNDSFEDFVTSYQNAVDLTIPMYITILQFFRSNWPKMKENVQFQFDQICKEAIPIQLDPHIHFTCAAKCNYEMTMEDASMFFIKNSEDNVENEFEIKRNGKSVFLNADTMHKLAEASIETLVDILYKAGYTDPSV